MKVFVTGGTGFVGSELLRQLVAAGHTVRVLVRPGSEAKLATRQSVEIHRGDATDPSSLEGAMQGCNAVIHLVGIIREFPKKGITFRRLHVDATRHVLEAGSRQQVKRFLHMSANGAREGTTSPYFQTKWEAEQLVHSSGLDWTVFRPSIIFGPGDEFVSMLAGFIRRLPVVPVIGDGQYRLAPVAVADVAAGFVKGLELTAASGGTFHCCGPQEHTYDQVLDLIGQALGLERVRKLHQPVPLVKPAVALFESLPFFPITRIQLSMLLEGNVCDPTPWAETFGLTPRFFAEEVGIFLGK